MRSFVLPGIVLALTSATVGNSDNPFLKLTESSDMSNTHVTAKNISHKPVVAYVVVADSGSSRTVLHGVYTGKDSFKPGTTVVVGDIPAKSGSVKPTLRVDYIRLSDGAVWGDAKTEEAAEIVKRFHN